MICLWAFLWLPATATWDVSAETLSGPPRTGALVALNDQQFVLEVQAQQETVDLRDLLVLTFNHGQPVSPPATTVWVELVDGSRLEGTSYTAANRVATVRVGDRSLTVETRDIRSVRFHPPSAELNDQWREISGGAARGDVVVLRRSKTSLDQLEGVFHDVTEETVDFEYDEQRVAVKRNKLEGIIYFHGPARDLPPAVCTVWEINGSAWHARSLALAGEQLRVTTSGGPQYDIPVSQVTRCDFSTGNVTYLGDLEYELAECTPFIATRLPEKRVLQLYAPRRDASFEGSGLWLGENPNSRQYEKGLAIHSRSRLVFRLAQPHRKLIADVGIDSRLRGRGHVVLVITGDGKELFRRSLTGKDPPLPLDLDLAGVRRLEILVDFGETLDVGDHLNFCNARIVK